MRMDDGTRRGVHRLAGAPRHHPGPGQGRHPLPPRRRRRRGEGAGRRHDVQDRGRSTCPSAGPRAACAATRRRCRSASSSGSPAATPTRSRRCSAPTATCPAPDVNTDGRVMAWLMDTLAMTTGPAPGRRRHRQAAVDRRHPGPRRRHVGRAWSCASGPRSPSSAAARRAPGRHPGLRQGRRAARLPAVVGRHARRRRERRRRRRASTRAASTPATLADHVAAHRHGRRLRRRRPDRPTTTCATVPCELFVPGRPRRRDHRRRWPSGWRPGSSSRRPTARRPPTAEPVLDAAGHRRRARHPRQRRRRHRVVLRVGPEPSRATPGTTTSSPSRLRAADGAAPSPTCGPRPSRLGVSLRRAAFALALERVAAAIDARGLFP